MPGRRGIEMTGALALVAPGTALRDGLDRVVKAKRGALLLVLEGEGRLVAGDREEAARPGTMVFVPAGEARGLKAETRIVALHVVSPPPTEADHAEVVARLKEGDWR